MIISLNILERELVLPPRPIAKFLPLAFVKKQIIEPRHEISSKVVF